MMTCSMEQQLQRARLLLLHYEMQHQSIESVCFSFEKQTFFTPILHTFYEYMITDFT